jgi:hypothetical protein
VRYKLNLYILFRRNSIFKGLVNVEQFCGPEIEPGLSWWELNYVTAKLLTMSYLWRMLKYKDCGVLEYDAIDRDGMSSEISLNIY